MDNKQLLKTLEEEVLKIKNRVNRKRSIILEYSKIEQKENEILSLMKAFSMGQLKKRRNTIPTVF